MPAKPEGRNIERSIPERRPRVVIIGAGFGGLAAAKALRGAPFDVTLIDRHNYHLFQPLLYQVATAGLSPADIASPTRSILRDQGNVTVLLGRVSGVDLEHREVITEEAPVPFDYLIIATGAQHAYFGHDDWMAYAPGLKTIDDALYVRRRILLAFEKAETEPDALERQRLLTFAIVGGGPTGVEMAGAIAELAKRALARDFRSIDPRSARIVLVEAGSRLLATFDPTLSEDARCALVQLGVEVRLSSPVTACDELGLSLGAERLETRTIIWAAGVRASLAGRWLNIETDRAGRVTVGPDLSLPGRPDVFVIGDTALACEEGGKPLPGVASVAKQQGMYVAKVLRARARGGTTLPFRYRDFGSLATIGRKHAIAQIGRVKLRGFPAWIFWSLVHIYFLIGFRNRFFVAASWLWSYLTFQRGARLITGASGSEIASLDREGSTPAAPRGRSPVPKAST